MKKMAQINFMLCSIFWGMQSTHISASPINYYTFDIAHRVTVSENSESNLEEEFSDKISDLSETWTERINKSLKALGNCLRLCPWSRPEIDVKKCMRDWDVTNEGFSQHLEDLKKVHPDDRYSLITMWQGEPQLSFEQFTQILSYFDDSTSRVEMAQYLIKYVRNLHNIDSESILDTVLRYRDDQEGVLLINAIQAARKAHQGNKYLKPKKTKKAKRVRFNLENNTYQDPKDEVIYVNELWFSEQEEEDVGRI